MVIGLVVWDGADRRGADATSPLVQSPAAPPSSPIETLRVGSFNIHSGKGSDGVRDLKRTAHLLSGLDIVGLYEVRAGGSANEPNQAATIAKTLESGWLFAPTERQWWSDHFGNGLLMRTPLESVLRIPLINTRGKAYRNAILATVKLQSTDVRIIAVHIDREQDRRPQLQAMIHLFLNLREPCVLMGDLNSPYDDPLLQELKDRPGVHSPLHVAGSNEPANGNIDWIFTRGLKTVSAELVENKASDHHLLKAELTLLNGSMDASDK